MEGVKHDQEKPMWNLLPFTPVRRIVDVLTYGCKKYSKDNWKKVPDMKERYFAAMMRHITAWWEGEKNDPESGLPHLAHAGCCILFLLWREETLCSYPEYSEHAIGETTQTIIMPGEIKTPETCPNCNGKGFTVLQKEKNGPTVDLHCFECKGTGKV